MPTDTYPERTEQNIIDSDGTLVIFHGKLTEGSEYTRQMAKKHGKSWIHVDASRMSIDAAVQLLRTWITGSRINVLNVAGPRASTDPKICGTTIRLLSVLIKMISLGSENKQDKRK